MKDLERQFKHVHCECGGGNMGTNEAINAIANHLGVKKGK